VNSSSAFSLTAFADEAAGDLSGQLKALQDNGIQGIDVRSLDGVNVIDLDEPTLARLKEGCETNGIVIQTVSSPVNKVQLSEDNRGQEFEKLKRAVKAAHALGTTRIRIFSPEVPQSAIEESWPKVKAWMGDMVKLAADENLLLIHENDARFFGAYPEGAKKLCEEFFCLNFKFAFDFANTVLIGYRPMYDWFPWLLPFLDTLHIKDALEMSSKIMPAGEGDGEIIETLKWLKEKGWSGPLTIEPHLKAAGPYGGFSGPELFKVAADALKNVMNKAGVAI